MGSADDGLAAGPGLWGGTGASSPPDAQDGFGSPLSEAPAEPASGRTRDLPLWLRGVRVDRVNHVWSADITYIRLRAGFVLLVAVIDGTVGLCCPGRSDHHGRTLLCGSAGEGAKARVPRDINTARGASPPVRRSQHAKKEASESHGWPRPSAGQRVCGAVMADREQEEVYLQDINASETHATG